MHGSEAHAAHQPGHGQEQRNGVAVPRHSAVPEHVHRVEQQHVHAATLLADEERQRDGRRHPHAAPQEQRPVRRRSDCRFLVTVHRRGVGHVGRIHRGGRCRRCRGARHVAQVQPPVHLVRLGRSAFGPEPHRRFRHHEQSAEIGHARQKHDTGYDLPVKEHGQYAFHHHAQAHGHGDQRYVQRSQVGRSYFGNVQKHARTHAC